MHRNHMIISQICCRSSCPYETKVLMRVNEYSGLERGPDPLEYQEKNDRNQQVKLRSEQDEPAGQS